MKKQNKSSITRKLDKECSRIVRSQGICAKCGKVDYGSLQCAHIFSRTYRSVRWYMDNLLPLCASCHFWGHRNPVLFTEFVKNYLGEVKYENLKNMACSLKKWQLSEMQELYETLRKKG